MNPHKQVADLFGMKFVLCILIGSILISCSGNPTPQAEVNGRNQEHLSTDADKQVEDTLFSVNKIVISIIPSNRYLDSMQQVVPEDEWSEVVSDNEYYRVETEKYLIMKGYKLIHRPAADFWYFKLANGQLQQWDARAFYSTWGNLIFNGEDSAFIFESTSPELELKGKI